MAEVDKVILEIGYGCDVELVTGQIDADDIRDKVDELDGAEKNYASDDDEHEILEMHIQSCQRHQEPCQHHGIIIHFQ